MMGIERLDYFLSAVRCGSFTRAAQECGVVPSTISQQIASLEKEVGFSLFARKGRGVVLTRQGELFYQKAQGLQTEYRTAVRQTQMAKRLQVGVNSMHNLQALQQLFLQQEHDGLEVCIEQYGARQAREKLRSGECDLFWGYASPAWEGFMQKTLAPQPVYVWSADLPEGPVGLEQLLSSISAGNCGNICRRFVRKLRKSRRKKSCGCWITRTWFCRQQGQTARLP